MACVIRHCKSRMGSKANQNGIVSFHKFPRDKILQDKWIAAVSRDVGWIPRKHHRVCSKHFTVGCFFHDNKYRRLKDNAVPTLLLQFKPDTSFMLAPSTSPQVSSDSEPSVNSTSSVDAAKSSSTDIGVDTCISHNKCATHLALIVALKRKVGRLETLAKKRLLKINSLRQSQRRLRKRNTILNSHLIDILSEEEVVSRKRCDDISICEE